MLEKNFQLRRYKKIIYKFFVHAKNFQSSIGEIFFHQRVEKNFQVKFFLKEQKKFKNTFFVGGKNFATHKFLKIGEEKIFRLNAKNFRTRKFYFAKFSNFGEEKIHFMNFQIRDAREARSQISKHKSFSITSNTRQKDDE